MYGYKCIILLNNKMNEQIFDTSTQKYIHYWVSDKGVCMKNMMNK